MRKIILGIVTSVCVLGALAGCASAGRGKGPVDAFAFLSATNKGLPQNAIGAINEGTVPKEISVVVPPGTDMRGLVATLSLNKEAVITVISSGSRIVQQNGTTPNDFSVPLTYSIEVTGDKEPWTYKVIVREAETNAQLSMLVLPRGSVLQPAFSPAVHEYTLEVPFATEKVRIEARGQSRLLRSVSVDGVETAGAAGAAVVDFQSVQELAVAIATLAEDGATRGQYTLNIQRGAPDSNALLDSLDLQGITLSPAFSPSQLGYRAQVPFETRQLALRARPQSQVATIGLAAPKTVGAGQTSTGVLPYSGNPADKAGALVDFSTAARLTIVVAVTAQDGSVQQYLLDIQRAPPERNNLLADLSISVPPDGAVAISPQFSAGQPTYRAVVPYSARQLAVMARAQGKFAAMELQPVSAGAFSSTGSLSSATGAVLDLPAGQQRILFALMVTAQDGSVRRYNVEITRAAPDPNADLAALDISVGTLSPGFSPKVMAYSLTLAASAGSVKITANAASSRASVMIAEQPGVKPSSSQAVTQEVGQGATAIVTFIVSAEDGTQRRYRITIGRQAEAAVTQPAATQPAATQPAETVPVSPPPADTGTDRVLVSAKNLRLQSREIAALAANNDQIGKTARVTVRYYRTDELITQYTTPVDARQQGDNLAVSLSYRSNGVALDYNRLIEVETAIPTSAGRFLYYTEARAADSEIKIDLPFLLYGTNPRVSWPSIGSPVSVAGYLSNLPLGKVRAVDKEDFGKNAKGEYAIEVEIADASTGASLGTDTVYTKPGQGRDQALLFGKAMRIPEGAAVNYTLTASAKNGKTWTTSSTTQVWTTVMAYPSGFQPAILFVSDDLSASP